MFLGRGSIRSSHPGNVQFRVIADAYQNDYINTSKRSQKNALALHVYESIQPCRFLRCLSDHDENKVASYQIVSFDEALGKIKQKLRHHKKRNLTASVTAPTKITKSGDDNKNDASATKPQYHVFTREDAMKAAQLLPVSLKATPKTYTKNATATKEETATTVVKSCKTRVVSPSSLSPMQVVLPFPEHDLLLTTHADTTAPTDIANVYSGKLGFFLSGPGDTVVPSAIPAHYESNAFGIGSMDQFIIPSHYGLSDDNDSKSVLATCSNDVLEDPMDKCLEKECNIPNTIYVGTASQNDIDSYGNSRSAFSRVRHEMHQPCYTTTLFNWETDMI